mgnify:CR=1 FL=1
MPNPFLSGRISTELNQQIDEFLARTGESRTEMMVKAVSAYIGVEVPHSKETGDRRLENLEQEVAELKGAVKSLYEKFATFTLKTENTKVESELITACDNNDNSDNIKDIHKIDHASSDNNNTVNNNDNVPEVAYPTEVTPIIDDEKSFISIDTTEAARLTKLDPKKFTDLRGAFNRKLKKENQTLPEKKILDIPIKMTPSLEIKIAKIPYDIFYVGQSKEGRNLWSLIPKTTLGEQIPLTFPCDN